MKGTDEVEEAPESRDPARGAASVRFRSSSPSIAWCSFLSRGGRKARITTPHHPAASA